MTFLNTEQPAFKALANIVSERTSQVMICLGAGLSKAASLPNWPELRRHLERTLAAKLNDFTPEDRRKGQYNLREIKKQRNPWVAFERLEKQLGATSFHSTVREALEPTSTSTTIPSGYRSLWQISHAGVLSLNLDSIASRAFSDTYPSRHLRVFTSVDVARHADALSSYHPFLCQLHGRLDDVSSWVLTKKSLRRLMQDQPYRAFLQTCLMSRKLIFIGITVDDLAIGSHLDNLLTYKIQHGPHFWLTNRRDQETDIWAEARNIQIIRYDSNAGQIAHNSAVEEFFTSLSSYTSTDEPVKAIPIVHEAVETSNNDEDWPPQGGLKGKGTDELREILNRHANRLLEDGNDSSAGHEKYSQFLVDYDEEIYRSWYLSPQPGKNKLFDYTVEDEIAQGAFGRVFRAATAEGLPVAIKLLHNNILNSSRYLECFRRGVHSMRILQQRSVAGIVPYIDAGEIPAFVVMEWIEGPNLEEAVQAHILSDWAQVSRVFCELAQIVRSAHLLPERVLHRDLRPANIMLRNGYDTPEHWEVVVLDFDLSWHLEATGQSIAPGESGTGFLAPEQQPLEKSSFSTRSSAVDAYGFGMTLFFALAKRAPYPGEGARPGWIEEVRSSCRRLPRVEWQSLPERFARLVINSTVHKQSDRWDMAQIESELVHLSRLLEGEAQDVPAEYVAEEVAVRAFGRYTWDPDGLRASWDLASGMQCVLAADESSRRIELRVEWSDDGKRPRKEVGKWLPKAIQQVSSMLRQSGWDVDSSTAPLTFTLKATRACAYDMAQVKECAESVSSAVEELQFR